MIIAWTFSNDRGQGTYAIAAGFTASDAAALPLATDGYANIPVALNNANSFSLTQEVLTPEAFVNSTLLVHFVATVDDVLAFNDLVITYGDATLEVDFAQYIEGDEATDGTFHVFARLYVGDGLALNSEDLIIEAFGLGAGDDVIGTAQVLFVNGLEPDEVPTLYQAGTVSTYTPALALNVNPVTPHDFVFTAAIQGRAADASSTLAMTATNFEQGATQGNATNTSNAIGYELVCLTSFDCDCTVDPAAKTLAQLRQRLLIRAGYASQASNPPASVVLTFNDYLQSAQEYIYHRYKALQTKRLFAWRLLAGTRYYGLYDSVNCCAVSLDRYKIEGAWVEDPNGTWWPLVYGIDPSFYTLEQNFGWPNYYEIRSCIEVFPRPDAGGYKLWIKGNQQLAPFTADADLTTIDPEPVFLWALGLAKSHKGDRDAGVPTPGQETGFYGMAIRYVKDLIAGAHVNRRYIPGTAEIPIATPPVMVQFDS